MVTLPRHALLAAAASGLFAARGAAAQPSIVLDGQVSEGAPDHVDLPFEVPAGTREIELRFVSVDGDDILDFGLVAPSDYRGWSGSRSESAIVNDLATTRSYNLGPIEAGTWKIDVGKARIAGGSATYHVEITFRSEPTLPPQTERSPYVAPAPLRGEAGWYAGDFHVHSIESNDASPPIDQIVAVAASRGLDFVELSDHNGVSQLDFMNAAQARAGSSVLLVPGNELTTYHGHANAIGATRFVDYRFEPTPEAIRGAVDAFHAQGALFVVNHPAFDLGGACIGCAWELDVDADRIDGIEIVTAGTAQIFYEPTVRIWEDLAGQGRRIAAIGGSDDHSGGERVMGFNTALGSPTTMVFAEELSVAGILDGIRAGRTVVKVRGPEDPMVELQAVRGGALGLQVVARITGGAGKDARFVVDGQPGDFKTVEGDPYELVLDLAPPAAARRVRAEVFEGAAPITLTSHVWIDPEGGTTTLEGGGCAVERTAARAAPGGLALLAAAAAFLHERRRRRHR